MRYYSFYFCYYNNHKASNGEVWNDVQMSITASDEKPEDCDDAEFGGVEQYSRDKGLVSLEFDNFADLLTKAREFKVGSEVLELSGLTENEEALIREFCLTPEEDKEDESDEDDGVKELLDEIDECLSNKYRILEGDSDTLYVKRRGTDVHYSIHVSECYD